MGVVVGVDGSDSALDAVRWAAREAADRHALVAPADSDAAPHSTGPIRLEDA